MNFDIVKQEMIEDEDKRSKAYKCTAGKTTIGIGRNLDDVGLSDDEIDYLFNNDYNAVVKDIEKLLPDFNKFPNEVQHVLFNMRFQLGAGGFRRFKKVIFAANTNNLQQLVTEMKNSKWYKKDTPERAQRLVDRIEKLRAG